jgi:hypothetical protein
MPTLLLLALGFGASVAAILWIIDIALAPIRTETGKQDVTAT